MKGLGLIITVLFSFFLVENGHCQVNWHTPQEWIDNTDKSKPVYAFIWSEKDAFGKIFEQNTLGNQQVVEYLNTHYYAVKFLAEDTTTYSSDGYAYKDHKQLYGRTINALAYEMSNGLSALPTHFFQTANSRNSGLDRGNKSPEEFLLALEYYNGNSDKMSFAEFTLRKDLASKLARILNEYSNHFEPFKGKEQESTLTKLVVNYESTIQLPQTDLNKVTKTYMDDGKTEHKMSCRLANNITIDSANALLLLWRERIESCQIQSIVSSASYTVTDLYDDDNDPFREMHFIYLDTKPVFADLKISIKFQPVFGSENVSMFLTIK
ncbi:MAG: hypothetical protein KDC92_09125 [Bacteroidetes bacterium]|nr:hypothetical protein [Bacteroidota bacterium]